MITGPAGRRAFSGVPAVAFSGRRFGQRYPTEADLRRPHEAVTCDFRLQGVSETRCRTWSGVPLTTLIELARPRPDARYVVFHGMDDKATSAAEAGKARLLYEAVGLRLLCHPQTILAYEMSGEPLSVPHGAPLRVRLEVQLGFKMVKWLRAIQFVRDYREIGDGHGGWREDHAYYYQSVAI